MTNAPANPESLTTEQPTTLSQTEPTTLSQTERAIETRARRAAKREGYFMRKSRAALSIDNHGQFRLIDGNNRMVAGEKFDMSAQDVLDYLAE
jgi:hypothetical protein